MMSVIIADGQVMPYQSRFIMMANWPCSAALASGGLAFASTL